MDWTNEKNARRCALIDKDIDGNISPDEKVELARLQAELHEYLEIVAPLRPQIEAMRKLLERFEQKFAGRVVADPDDVVAVDAMRQIRELLDKHDES